ncbi:tRNA (cytosine(38)-C(5))-methyltransferase-like isoform X2 [Limulus polyphemus]|uniref:tRNA (cytosine(38)-C(5))-methyltransferase n=1 Tax=Limulus polyphemus TaxID=6850 RepID=A0ABM1STL0_LIMPO|nr:tRNA (cytosine(38)-C(5))-methyltransferase-like isoform X2 [Limulus polyphemus]
MVIRVLELFSGIGGMHCSLNATGISFKIEAAVDINTTANQVYMHNFPDTTLLQRNILSLSSKEIDNLKPDLITMSPPCQPFTRQGLKQDCEDVRTQPLLHILQVISDLEYKPYYIFLENVKGFETSRAKEKLVSTLQSCGYKFKEFLLTPTQFGIPNSRLRYYLLAKFRFGTSCVNMTQELTTSLRCEIKKEDMLFFKNSGLDSEIDSSNTAEGVVCRGGNTTDDEKTPLSFYLENKPDLYFQDYLLPDKVLLKFPMILDIVDRRSLQSCCFTKGYGHYVQGTGSVIHAVSHDKEHPQTVELLKQLKLRYFTPREVANLLHFPSMFSFPSHLKKKQLYQILGNSINVYVVCELLKLLLQ